MFILSETNYVLYILLFISVHYNNIDPDHRNPQYVSIPCTLILTLESLLSSDILEEESGLPGGVESTSKGPSSSFFNSDGVCNSAA